MFSMKTIASRKFIIFILILASAASMAPKSNAATFGEDVAFLRQHTDIIVLSDTKGVAEVAIAPAWQGRVMTSTAASDAGRSFGWINRELIASGALQPHMNAFGGEDRFWMGPEGGQFSVYFAKGAKFEFANWQVPAPFDTLPFKTVSQVPNRASFAASVNADEADIAVRRSQSAASFALEFALTNYSGTRFRVAVNREVRLLSTAAAWEELRVPPSDNVSLVAYETDNRISNAGRQAWQKETGLLSIWILGMFTPSPAATIVVPIKPGPESELGVKVTADYFGAIPPERLKVKDDVIFLSADGKFRSKIGVNPKRSRSVLGAYDAENRVLTIVQFDQPAGIAEYVNSLWKLQDNPYGGDALNSYNDGPAAPGAKPLGPFFEMESSSPAASLAPGASLSHLHRTIHLTGSETALDPVARAVLGVSIPEIKSALQ
jgi:hypothetical protein